MALKHPATLFTLVGNDLLMSDGTVLFRVHNTKLCAGQTCVVHSPTDHHMRDWPMAWVNGLKVFSRICEHDCAHLDPDECEHLGLVGWHTCFGSCDGCCGIGEKQGTTRVSSDEYEQMYLTTEELATLCRTEPPTVRYWLWAGKGPRSVKVGRRRLYKRTDVETWLAANATEGGPL